jgi:hypothetical protein
MSTARFLPILIPTPIPSLQIAPQDKGHVVQFEMSPEQVQQVVSELDKIDATLEAAQA